MIWIAISFFVSGTIIIGIFFILEAKGITVPSFISNTLAAFSYNTLVVAGSSNFFTAFTVLIIAICMRHRIETGAKAVEIGAIFLSQNCSMIMVPVIQALLVFITIAALIIGSGYIYSTGGLSLGNHSGFAVF
jgi:hypothetical protein